MKACMLKSLLAICMAAGVNTWTYAFSDIESENAKVVKSNNVIKTVYLDGFQGEPVWRRPRDKVIAIGDVSDISGLVVLAEDYKYDDKKQGNATCDNPFKPNSFSGAIVVCQAGDTPVEVQANNVALGGASALIVLHAKPDAKIEKSESAAKKLPVVHLDSDVLWTFKNWVKYSKPGSASLSIVKNVLN